MGVRHKILLAAIGLVASFLSLPVALEAQQMQQDYQRFQIDRGATLYSSNCAECHADGTGVPGVNLRTGQFPHGSTDDDLMNAIRNGIPGTMMPPHDLPGADLAALVAYIRFLAQDQTGPVKLGDSAKGRVLFQQNGCLSCHRVGAQGSRTAMNLSDTGTLHPPSYLERALLDPNSVLAEVPESRLVRVVTKEGKTISGRRLNEDTYTLQLIDDRENLISLDKSDLRSLTILKESPMPSVKAKLTTDQLSDLVAYLASLKGSTPQTAAAQYGAPPGVGSGFAAGRGGRGGAGRGGAAPPGSPTTAAPAAPNATPPATPGGNR
jgi:putative heme-binding domain-containing protein